MYNTEVVTGVPISSQVERAYVYVATLFLVPTIVSSLKAVRSVLRWKAYIVSRFHEAKETARAARMAHNVNNITRTLGRLKLGGPTLDRRR